MKHAKLYVRYYTVLNKLNSRGVCPLYCKISYNKDSKKFSTGIFVEPQAWSKELQKIDGQDIDSVIKNGLLQTINSKLLKIELEMQLLWDEFAIDDIYNKFNGTASKKTLGIMTYFYQYIVRLEGLIGKDIQLSTWNKFKYVHQNLKQFVADKYGKDVPIDKLNLSFLEEFEYWLKVTKSQKQITINKTIQRLRKPIRTAVNDGLINLDPFSNYKAKKVSNQVIFLTVKELDIFESSILIQPRLEIIRKLFIFCCHTGLGYAEMKALKVSNIQKGFDGRDWIVITRQKTSATLSIPLLPKANELMLELYFYKNDGLPSISNQKFNSYLKEIADIMDIKKRLTHHVARKTFASTVLLYNDVPMEIVQQLLGHSSITITEQSYGKILKKQVSREMEKFFND
jgi:integrase